MKDQGWKAFKDKYDATEFLGKLLEHLFEKNKELKMEELKINTATEVYTNGKWETKEPVEDWFFRIRNHQIEKVYRKTHHRNNDRDFGVEIRPLWDHANSMEENVNDGEKKTKLVAWAPDTNKHILLTIPPTKKEPKKEILLSCR